jgi:hypothetical protein
MPHHASSAKKVDMKILNHPAVIALGTATLCFSPFMWPLVSPLHLAIYHTSGSASTIFGPALLNLFALWALITAVLVFVEKPGRFQVIIWTALTVAFPWILLRSVGMLTFHTLPHWLSALILTSSALSFVALVVLWRPSSPSFQRVREVLGFVLGFAALNGLLMLGHVFWFAWQARACNSPVPLHQRQTSAALHAENARIVWILLDELSYQQVYEQRFPGLQLPAFDSVARQSTIFTHVVPAGAYTENIIPSLITGLPVDSIRVSADAKRLTLHDPISGEWQAFDAHRTVFQDALAAGYSTAVVGWYNPYCRILPQVLDRCFWTSRLVYQGAMVAGWPITKDLFQSSFQRIKAMLSFRPANTVTTDTAQAISHIEDYRELRDAADATLSDPSANFVFLHMPIPHPVGIYDRQKKILTTGRSSYIDNLALADSYLAHVRSLLQQRGEWDASTVVIMGDHSWRTGFLWPYSSLTPEEQAASHGAQFDNRPVYIVKLPQQRLPAHIDAPFAAVHTRALLDGILSSGIRSSDDLTIWVQQQGPAPEIPH